MTADPRACRQILTNVVSNAVKFSPEGACVRVGLERVGEWARFCVRDEGEGIAAEDVARLGQPFVQVSDGLSRRHEGTGLGLSIVKGLVDLHGGVLAIESAPDAGTTVRIDLPLNGDARRDGGRDGEHAGLGRAGLGRAGLGCAGGGNVTVLGTGRSAPGGAQTCEKRRRSA